MKTSFENRLYVIQNLISKKLDEGEAANKLNVSTRTIRRYKQAFLEHGPDGLKDHRSGNNRKINSKQKRDIFNLKKQGPWRSARFIRDKLRLSVHERTVWGILAKNDLTHLNTKRLKPLQRFVADNPNDLWQTDIMGKIDFPFIGTCYLIATLDDHSRFCLSSGWFKTQRKINVFQIWYQALAGWGLPKGMLQDRGSQYKARTQYGQTDYQFYADVLKIKLIWAKRAQTKGKIERFFRFVQQDFARENVDVLSVYELNRRFNKWMFWYNYQHKPSFFHGKKTRAGAYCPSIKKERKVNLRTMLIVEERRKVRRDSTISLYGEIYKVPPGYIDCRIWVRIIGNKVIFEAMGKVLLKTRLKIR